jgi:hypothetical protein
LHLVDRPDFSPGHCVVNLTHRDPEGFIDTGVELPYVDSRVQISVRAVRDLGRFIGMAQPEEWQEAQGRIAELEARVAELEAQLSAAEEFEKAVSVVAARKKVKVGVAASEA